MDLFKLYTHQKSFSAEDLILNPREHPGAKLQDVVEIYHPDDDCPNRLLLQITAFNADLKREIISVESNIAAAFNLRTYADVVIRVVDPSRVLLDSVELTFKEQYIGRSEMWRLKKLITNKCVYLNKQIEHCNTSVRCQIFEMWSNCGRVSCGVISEETKIVFRSSTSMVYLFIQMSSEMWDFDIHGDLYFERAINGFLTDLFSKWKRIGSNHDVTIILFSRTLYSLRSIDSFPDHMKNCILQDYRGGLYEDFYQVILQNERNDDWSTLLGQLRNVFTAYKKYVTTCHERPGIQLPHSKNSTSAQGNFLEVLNISLNVFEKHFLDRSFDRTGQLVIVVTPGVGVFEVDCGMTNLTKQRIINSGVGVDLVCVGEQPLHIVPLLKFLKKDGIPACIDDYSMPYWINLSFYPTNKNKFDNSIFVPRIQVPIINQEFFSKSIINYNVNKVQSYRLDALELNKSHTNCMHNTLFDYDTYDDQIFGSLVELNSHISSKNAYTKNSICSNCKISKISYKGTVPSSPQIKIASDKYKSDIAISLDISPHGTTRLSDKVLQNHRATFNTKKHNNSDVLSCSLFNPFKPLCLINNFTSNRRRWTHIFPNLMIEHLTNSKQPAKTNKISVIINKKINLGSIGELKSIPDIKSGTDWKSLTIPACLPITTDYFPDTRSLHDDYLVSDYSLLPDTVNHDCGQNRTMVRSNLSIEEVFEELVSQRLAQGFQLILPNTNCISYQQTSPVCYSNRSGYIKSSMSCYKKKDTEQNEILLENNISIQTLKKKQQFFLSVGCIFHAISFGESEINVTRFRPRQQFTVTDMHYLYQLKTPCQESFLTTGSNFSIDKLEHFNWNYVDQYICTRGDIEYPLIECLKYWRFRMLLLPKEHPATKCIINSLNEHVHVYCDIYTDLENNSLNKHNEFAENFVRFVEINLNRIQKTHYHITKSSPSTQQSHLTRRRHSTSFITRPLVQGLGSSPFRERIGSNRLPALRPRYVNESHLSANASLLEVFEAMKNPICGISFVTKAPNLPPLTFVLWDAFIWINSHVKGKVNSLKMLEDMQSSKLICHASGDSSKPMKLGFFLYYILNPDCKFGHFFEPLGELSAFENEWIEVEVPFAIENDTSDFKIQQDKPEFLREHIEINSLDDPIYKQSRLELDSNDNNDRIEWGHLRYHRKLYFGHAFEIVTQWLTASGTKVYENLYVWMRKAQQFGFQFIPFPADPITYPNISQVNPLRKSIFVPLDLHYLEFKRGLFTEFCKESRSDRILLLQEAILKRFGFLRCYMESYTGSNVLACDRLYVHCTGNMFIIIPMPISKISSQLNRTGGYNSHKKINEDKNIVMDQEDVNFCYTVGYHWSWNHMITSKKWKSLMLTNSPDADMFQLRILQDFKEFCANKENRLLRFWDNMLGYKNN